MERRDVILQTIENMERICCDIGAIMQIIEQKMENQGFEALGDSGVTWENSTSLYKPEMWPNRWFARGYVHKDPKTVVGYCIHLGGSGYYSSFRDRIETLSLSFPVVNVSLLKVDKKVASFRKVALLDCVWAAGWAAASTRIEAERLVFGQTDLGKSSAASVTYFVDLFSLSSNEMIDSLIVEPLMEMFRGNEAWVLTKVLPVIRLATAKEG